MSEVIEIDGQADFIFTDFRKAFVTVDYDLWFLSYSTS